VVYHERFTCLCELSNTIISSETISATVHNLAIIKPFRNFPVPQSWFIQARWSNLFLTGNCVSAYSNWSVWLDPTFVKEVEFLIADGKIKNVYQMIAG
jgi:hypothetical protein